MRDALEGKQYVEQYVQTLTHEIKSPLAAIQGAAELLQEDMPPDRRETFLRNIQSETKRIRAIVEKMLLLSALELRKGLEHPECIQLSEVIADVEASHRPLLEGKGLRLTIVNRTDQAPIFGEYFLVRQAVANLVQNAIEFSPQGSNIQIVVQKTDKVIELDVQDEGAGIPAYALERVFERFYSLPHPDSGRKSSGLGLSFVSEVAQLHCGSARLRNRPDGGASALLTLPLYTS
jgi:two-component system sensor histidine kinase CreC